MGKQEECRKILNEIDNISESMTRNGSGIYMKPHKGEFSWKKYASNWKCRGLNDLQIGDYTRKKNRDLGKRGASKWDILGSD